MTANPYSITELNNLRIMTRYNLFCLHCGGEFIPPQYDHEKWKLVEPGETLKANVPLKVLMLGSTEWKNTSVSKDIVYTTCDRFYLYAYNYCLMPLNQNNWGHHAVWWIRTPDHQEFMVLGLDSKGVYCYHKFYTYEALMQLEMTRSFKRDVWSPCYQSIF